TFSLRAVRYQPLEVSAPSNGATIRLAKGKLFTAKSFATPVTQRPVPPLSDETITYIFYFDIFIRKNSFTGQGPEYVADLLQDASGQKWLQHMVFGTSQALIASGPSACTSGTMRKFFIQARTFEVCRSIIFNQSSFLATPEWMKVTRNLSEEANIQSRASVDDILNIIVFCSRLRARTGQFITTYASFPGVEVPSIDALELATEGFYLRDALETWKLDASFSSAQHNEMLLAMSYYSATSIYLSGNYDYDLHHWQAMTVAVPVLSRDEILKHVEDILQTTREALRSSTLSPLLHLFPLRVAGARSEEHSQRQAVTECLLEVKKQFAVSDAMLVELDELWSLSPIQTPLDS
ncbi:hypothetical protein CTAM01_02969, partial [Colletotrichum tamarilloi]